MKTSRIVYILVGLTAMATLAMAQPNDPNATAYMGVRLDPRPLPDVLIKHLHLASGKGLRIENIYIKSPADKAGLDRDDILMTFHGRDVNDMREFGDAVSKVGIGRQVSLEVIQSGKRRTVKLTLEARPKTTVFKYPQEPWKANVWRPGGVWRWDREQNQLVGMPFPGATPDVNAPPLLKEIYTCTFGQGEDQVTVIIEGNPQAGDSTVTVKTAQAVYKSPVGEVNELVPQAYREQANQAIKAARRNSDHTGQVWPPPRGGRDGGRGPRPPDRDFQDRNPSVNREGQQWQEYNTRRMLDWITKYLDGLQQSPKPMLKPDMDRLNLLEEKLRQVQDQIDQVKGKAADPNRPPP